MGQAKQRGTFDERKAAAVARDRAKYWRFRAHPTNAAPLIPPADTDTIKRLQTAALRNRLDINKVDHVTRDGVVVIAGDEGMRGHRQAVMDAASLGGAKVALVDAGSHPDRVLIVDEPVDGRPISVRGLRSRLGAMAVLGLAASLIGRPTK